MVGHKYRGAFYLQINKIDKHKEFLGKKYFKPIIEGL